MAIGIKLPKGVKNTAANRQKALVAARPKLAAKVGGTYNPATGRIDMPKPAAPAAPTLNHSAQYDAGMAGLAGAEDRIKRQYGFDPGYESDPFSQAALLKKHYEIARKGTGVSQAAHGNLYSSALRNALNADKSGYEEGVAAAKQQQENALADIASQRSDLIAGALDDTLANPPPAPAAPPKPKGVLGKMGYGGSSLAKLIKASGVSAPKIKVKKKGKR